MMGLVVLVFGAVYLLISIWAVSRATGWARANARKPWLWGGLMAFVMYNLVFWDLIPTLIAHKYYCSTQAGFWIYKTPEQWKAENPSLTTEELKSLGEKIYVGKMAWSFPFKPFENNPKRYAAMINKRIYLDSIHEKNISGIIPISKHISFIADTNNDQRLAQQITFGSGYGNAMTTGGISGFKTWLASSTCNDDLGTHTAEYDKFIEKIISLGAKND